MTFKGVIDSFGENSLGHGPYIKIPDTIFEAMLKLSPDKRIKCTLNYLVTVSRAMSPKGDFHYILLNKEVLKLANVTISDTVNVELQPDQSKYGIEITEEMEEVLFSDPEGSTLFHQLTPGKQRTLITIVNKIKSSQLRIERSFVILAHLKKLKGQIDFKILQQDFKDYRNKMRF
ncbi:hypothetical protein DI487_07080 [Flavobacterium sediminis]|uniref:DUF1905 domain-containing protein n=1 Tax=Flavobacterium sediminis TaxID=2201181 RepID=A0A2U8QUU1_9FLAO|nr:YdeI/OmpD-associated family protein [Flavobacterium sediminis]AWM13646.1 hypothetical protein DI487_07080 [Flavobacterium sediminis]